MRRNILYYPTINIPTGEWLRNAVLYWDEVSSIVPRDWKENKGINLSNDVHYLMQEEQFRPIRPDLFFTERGHRQDVEELKAEFLSLIDSTPFQSQLSRNRASHFRIHGSKGGHSLITPLSGHFHDDKATYDIFQTLKEKGLATRDPRDARWWYMDRTASLLYMSILAKYLARIDKEQTVIGTDLVYYERMNFNPVAGAEKYPVMTFDLKGAVPTPNRNVSMKTILLFKRKRRANLSEFRKLLVQKQRELATAKSREEIKDLVVGFQEDLERNIIDLSKTLKDEKISFVLKSLRSIVNFKSPSFWIGLVSAIDSSTKLTGLPDWVKAMAFAGSGAIEIGNHYMDTRNKNRAAEKSPFSYLYYTQKSGIVTQKKS